MHIFENARLDFGKSGFQTLRQASLANKVLLADEVLFGTVAYQVSKIKGVTKSIQLVLFFTHEKHQGQPSSITP
ncbi:MAG: hypothetical protein AAGF01_09665 [Cyanobacteria bacterium P01_G01_bin.38]